MTKTKLNRWTMMNARTGKLVHSRSYTSREYARRVKRFSAVPYKIFDTFTGRIVR